MSLISENRSQVIVFTLDVEDALYDLSKIIYRIRDEVKVHYPILSPLIDSELSQAYRLIDYAHDQVYKHNINLNLTYEE